MAGGPREETLWLVGPKLLLRSTTLPLKNLRNNPTRSNPAVTIMRDGWAPDSNCLLLTAVRMESTTVDMRMQMPFRLTSQFTDDSFSGSRTPIPVQRDLRDWFRSSAAHNADR